MQDLIVRALRAALAVLETPVAAIPEQPAAPQRDFEYDLDTFLIDPRYNLRKLSTLVEEGGFHTEVIMRHIATHSSKYVVKTARDGGKLIGLVNKAAVIAERQVGLAEACFEDDLIALLDGEHNLRRLSTLATKLGKTEAFILDFVTGDDDYVVKTKRSTGEKLVGLADRN